MTDVLSPSPKLQFFDNNGRPAVGYKVFTYEAGTTTKLDTYTDSGGLTANANPIVLDYRGEAAIWIPPNVSYKYVFTGPSDTDPPSAPIWTVDNLVSDQLVTLYGGVDSGSADAYVVNFDANFTSLTDGIVIYWIPSNTNTGPSTLNVNGLGASPIVDSNGAALVAQAIVANQITGTIYIGGEWTLLSASFTSGSFTGTFSTFTAPVTGTIFYRKVNGIVSLWSTSAISGTSSSNDLSMTGLPAFLRPSVSVTSACTVTDDGNTALAATVVVQTGGTTVFSVAKTDVIANFVQFSGGAFTSSGTKGIPAGWSVTYPL